MITVYFNAPSNKVSLKERYKKRGKYVLVRFLKYNNELLAVSSHSAMLIDLDSKKSKTLYKSLYTILCAHFNYPYLVLGESSGNMKVIDVTDDRRYSISLLLQPIAVSLDFPYLAVSAKDTTIIDIKSNIVLSKYPKADALDIKSGIFVHVSRQLKRLKYGLYEYSSSLIIDEYDSEYSNRYNRINRSLGFVGSPKIYSDYILISEGRVQEKGIIKRKIKSDFGRVISIDPQYSEESILLELPKAPIEVSKSRKYLALVFIDGSIGIKFKSLTIQKHSAYTIDISPSEEFLAVGGGGLKVYKIEIERNPDVKVALRLEERFKRLRATEKYSKILEYLEAFGNAPVETLRKASSDGLIIDLLKALLSEGLIEQISPNEFLSKIPAESLEGLEIIE